MIPEPNAAPDPVRSLTRPIIGIENRSALEVFDIMSDRIRLYAARELNEAMQEAQSAHHAGGAEVVAWRMTCTNPKLAKQPSPWVLLSKEPRVYEPGYKIEPLYSESKTHLALAIIKQVYDAVQTLGGTHGILSIIGSWGDTLSDEDVLSELKSWNAAPPAKAEAVKVESLQQAVLYLASGCSLEALRDDVRATVEALRSALVEDARASDDTKAAAGYNPKPVDCSEVKPTPAPAAASDELVRWLDNQIDLFSDGGIDDIYIVPLQRARARIEADAAENAQLTRERDMFRRARNLAEDRVTAAEAERDAFREALHTADKALDPFGSRVFNDNGDLTLTHPYPLTSGHYERAYFAQKQARAALAKPEGRADG